MLVRWLILSMVLFLGGPTSAEVINIRISAALKMSSVIFSASSGMYQMYGDGIPINLDIKTAIFQLTVSGDSIEVKALELPIGKFSSIRFIGQEAANGFKIKSIVPQSGIKNYEDNLQVNVKDQGIKLINEVDIEHYVGGVVEAESGGGNKPEYYKLQSILCRTYTLSHLRRHETEGYHLCDQVHCQAYKGKTSNAVILSAVDAVKGLVMVDSDLNLATAAYHSNCGGQTLNSEDVWSLPTSYLKSVRDTFCLSQPNAFWQKKILLKDWTAYLSQKYNYPLEDAEKYSKALHCSWPQERQVYFSDENLKIPLRNIREDWQLKSTYFALESQGEYVVFKGKGYGHGIGLCQEGAMRMALLGYSYKEIIHHYYKDVHLVDLSLLDFFKQ